jgi:hypothetical protein
MVGPYAERDRNEPDTPSLPSPAKPAPAKKRRGIMEDYMYYATPPPAALPYKYEEFDNTPKEVIRGGFGKHEADPPHVPHNAFYCFPPPSNAAYQLDSHCRLPHLHPHIYPELRKTSRSAVQEPSPTKIDNAYESDTDSDHTLQNGSIESIYDGLEMSIRGSRGLGLKVALVEGENHLRHSTPDAAVKIKVTELDDPFESAPPDLSNNFTKNILLSQTQAEEMNHETTNNHDIKRDPRILRTLTTADRDIYSANEQSAEYFNTNHQSGNGSGQPYFCNLCNKTHIPISGPTIDGIWALPEWFPRSRHSNPWDAFREVMGRLIALEESQKKGYQQRTVNVPEWDLHFREKSRHWTTKHARDWGGWWKCRGDKDAPEAERSCTHCHRSNRQEEQPSRYSRQHPPPIQVQKEYLWDYADHHTKMQGERDKQAALAMLRRDGIPQVYSAPITYHEQQALMQPRSKLETNATGRYIGERLLDIQKKYMNPQHIDSDTSEASPNCFPINPSDYP